MRVLVTGGGGFLGSHLARKLHERGDEVAVLGRNKYPQLPDAIERIQADIRDRESVIHALKGREAVYHAASIPGIWGDYKECYGVNVDGTQNIIDACIKNSVHRLVFTSSPSVVCGRSDLINADESTPYPDSYLCHYSSTKAMAEQRVMQANGQNRLHTVSLRPHLIWGPGDPHLVPRIIEKARSGKLIRVGDGRNRVSLVYIDNAVDAHILAGDALGKGNRVGGKCYFVTDETSVNLWDWIGELLARLGLPPVRRNISKGTAAILGGILEGIYSVFRVRQEPPMTRFLAEQLATSHSFDISRARKDLGYIPRVSQAEGMEKLIAFVRSGPER